MTSTGVVLLCLLAALSAGWLMVSCWRQRRHPTAVALAVCTAGIVMWSLGDAALMIAPRHDLWQIAWGAFTAGGDVTLAGMAMLAIALTTARRRTPPLVLALLFAEPVLAVGWITALAGRSWHPGAAGDVSRYVLEKDVVYWLDYGYCWSVFTLLAIVLVVAHHRAVGQLRAQLRDVLLAAVVPVVLTQGAQALDLVDRRYELTPVALSVTAVLLANAVLQHGLIGLLRLARDQVMDVITDPVLVIDRERNIVEANLSARRMFAAVHPGTPLQGPLEDVLELERLSVSESGWVVAVTLGESRLIFDVRTDAVRRGGRRLGTLLICRDITDFYLRHQTLQNEASAQRVRIESIEQSRDSLRDQAVRDPLTGLFNRRHLMARLTEDVDEALGAARPLSLLMIDIDHFKRVNDMHGHLIGDETIRAVARAVAAGCRLGDTAARFGGEEFVVSLPGVGLEAAWARAERLRHACAAVRVQDRHGLPVPVTVSIGVASLGPGDDPFRLMEAADQALYRAKQAGRDRVMIQARG